VIAQPCHRSEREQDLTAVDSDPQISAEYLPLHAPVRVDAAPGGGIDAGRDEILDSGIVDRLITDLDEVKEWADRGNPVEFSFHHLEPLFSLVIGHTQALAAAYSVSPADMEPQESDSDAGVVVHLRRHLEVQRRILGEAA
jgi:hypothetical protein